MFGAYFNGRVVGDLLLERPSYVAHKRYDSYRYFVLHYNVDYMACVYLFCTFAVGLPGPDEDDTRDRNRCLAVYERWRTCFD